jgi:isoamylase
VFPEARGPLAGVNYVACHDGFTLRDLCSYRRKRNRDNGEDNRDGTDANSSEPWGPEGPSAEPEVQRRRDRAARALLATVALAQGVPMIAQGDEMGRSQGGNNNAYCQDGPLTWVRWDLDERAADLLAFTARAFEVRRAWPALRRARFLRGAGGRNPADVRWFSPDGDELDGAGWGGAAGLGARLEGIDGEPALLLLLNPSPSPLTFELPAEPLGWHAVLDSARPPGARTDTSAVVPAHTLRLLAGGR